MLKSPDESEYPQKPPENSETKPQREIFKEFARAQLDSLGYSLLIKQLSDYLKGKREGDGKDVISELELAAPHLFEGDSDNNYPAQMVRQVKRIPNADEARKLLATAIFGEPAARNEDGTIVVTSFSVADPSTTIVQTKFRMLRDSEDNPKYAANVIGTDQLAQKLISESGFLPTDKTAETIFQLKKGKKKITLPHPTIESLNMELEGPLNTGNGDTRTAYSYRVRTTLSPST